MPETDSPNDATVTMLFEEAQRMLVRQEAVLATLRTQAVALLSVASLVAGLFGSRLMPGHHSLRAVVATWTALALFATWTALALFAAAALLAVVILLPRDWQFAHILQNLLADIEDRQIIAPINVAFTWTDGYEKMRASNQATLDWLMKCFWWACICVGVQVIAWIAAAA